MSPIERDESTVGDGGSMHVHAAAISIASLAMFLIGLVFMTIAASSGQGFFVIGGALLLVTSGVIHGMSTVRQATNSWVLRSGVAEVVGSIIVLIAMIVWVVTMG